MKVILLSIFHLLCSPPKTNKTTFVSKKYTKILQAKHPPKLKANQHHIFFSKKSHPTTTATKTQVPSRFNHDFGHQSHHCLLLVWYWFSFLWWQKLDFVGRNRICWLRGSLCCFNSLGFNTVPGWQGGRITRNGGGGGTGTKKGWEGPRMGNIYLRKSEKKTFLKGMWEEAFFLRYDIPHVCFDLGWMSVIIIICWILMLWSSIFL